MRLSAAISRASFPCGTGLIVNGLATPDMLVEIDIEAVIPEGAG
jgi:hypothetical protein